MAISCILRTFMCPFSKVSQHTMFARLAGAGVEVGQREKEPLGRCKNMQVQFMQLQVEIQVLQL